MKALNPFTKLSSNQKARFITVNKKLQVSFSSCNYGIREKYLYSDRNAKFSLLEGFQLFKNSSSWQIYNSFAKMIQEEDSWLVEQTEGTIAQVQISVSVGWTKITPSLKNLTGQFIIERLLGEAYDNNYLIYSRSSSRYMSKLSKFTLISSDGLEIFSHKIKETCFNFKMPNKETALIFCEIPNKRNKWTHYFNFKLIQWNLKTNQLVHLNFFKDRFSFRFAKMIYFQKSSLICICGTALSKSFEINNELMKRYAVSFSYYQFPLKEHQNMPVQIFKLKKLLPFPFSLRQYFYKMNDQSRVGTYKQIYVHNNFSGYTQFDTFSIEEGLKNFSVNFNSTHSNPPLSILDMRQLNPGRILLNISKKQQSEFKYYLISFDQLKNSYEILLSSKEMFGVQFSDFLLYNINYQQHRFLKCDTRYYLDLETLEPWREVQHSQQLRKISIQNHDRNSELWSKYDRQKNELWMKILYLGELRFEEKTIVAFLLVEYIPNSDDDLLYQVLDLRLEKW